MEGTEPTPKRTTSSTEHISKRRKSTLAKEQLNFRANLMTDNMIDNCVRH